MAVANLVVYSILENYFGGGVFGPAVKLIPSIYEEAAVGTTYLSKSKCRLRLPPQGGFSPIWAGYLGLQKIGAV
jgi:hypothetical protein